MGESGKVLNRQLLLLLVTGSLLVMAGKVIALSLPDMMRSLNVPQGYEGYIISLHFLTIALCSPILGILADRVGQKKVLMVSLVCYALTGVLGGVLQSFPLLLVTRAGLGIATGGIAAASLGFLTRQYPSGEAKTQAIAYIASSLALSNIFYPILGGLVGLIHWRVPFTLYGVGLPLALLVFWQLPPQSPRIIDKPPPNLKAQFWRKSGTWLWLALLGLTSASVYVIAIYLPQYLVATFATGTLTNGVLLAMQAIGAALISALGVKRVSQHLGIIPTVSLGWGIMALSYAILPQLPSIPLVSVFVLILGMGVGLVLPNLYNALSNQAPAHQQSTILAAGTGINFLGQFLSPTLFGGVEKIGGFTALFYTIAGVCVAMASLTLIPYTIKQLPR
ncbi:MFS transporter [Spirulina sp. CS-785/01]|uniref:MFS transporter n=1 Tax=Spirulina sp. CS-785/01 TaxID=3021716 RepID=UPI00232FA44D|nr:MFS transporter [Spirulina sp. CS-785/01]MDB9314387.1 MFS transporter [Spirulina sp. CS-785/01]